MTNRYLEKIAEISKAEAAAYGTAMGSHALRTVATRAGVNELRSIDRKIASVDERASALQSKATVKALFSNNASQRDNHVARAVRHSARADAYTAKAKSAKKDLIKKVTNVRKGLSVVTGAALATGVYHSLSKDSKKPSNKG